ncbi:MULTISPECIES: universal stress protein [Niastella]|uniref:Universal stress protein n=1 Tax=Niastella soli TaxID=2821487 RepID=A0ABS3YUG5_9BACT|nr:universal stress protein [Niastella soli]MBO9201571.1 universal stress protein [Niastella soli]
MEKILIAIDVNMINLNVLDFACYMAKLTNSKLIGIFLEDGETAKAPVTESVSESGIEVLPGTKEIVNQYDKNIHLFTDVCRKKQTNCAIHFDQGLPISGIIKESRFADLLIVDPEMSLRSKKERTPTVFIKEVLTKSECPVVIAPFSFNTIDEIVFAYDGSQSAVFAIKQFTYLFPELTDKNITILQVNEKDNQPIVESERVGELLQMHYSAIGYHRLSGNIGNELYSYLHGKQNVFVVMGAFGRSMISDFFKQSTAELIVETINLPVFIAHH